MSCLCFLGNTTTMENRTLATFGMVLKPNPESVVYFDLPLERFEAAMKDQFKLRDNFISVYLHIDNTMSKLSKSLFFNANSLNQQYSYTIIGNYAQIDGTKYIMNIPRTDKVSKPSIQLHVDQIKKLHQMYPNIKFYSYYVTQADETG